MKSKGFTINTTVKKYISIAFSALIIIIICFSFLLYQSNEREYEQNVIVNYFGRQRMLTQMIAKDVSMYYALVQSMEYENENQPKDELNGKYVEVRLSIEKARKEFNTILETMNYGILRNGNDKIDINKALKDSRQDLKSENELWKDFDSAIDIILSSDKMSDEFADASSFVNDNNLALLKYSDNITQSVVDSIKSEKRLKDNITLILFALALLIISVSLYSLFKYIIMPLNVMYNGLSEIGITNMHGNLKLPTKKEVTPVIAEISDLFYKINYLKSLIENMNRNLSFSETLDYIFSTFSTFIPYTYIGIALFKHDTNVLVASYGITDPSMKGKPNKLLGKQFNINETSLGKLIESGEARIINDLDEYTHNRPVREYNKIIMEYGIKASITLPLKVSDEPVGFIFFSSNKKNVYNEEHSRFLRILVNSIALSFEKNIYVNELIYSSIIALAKLAESRDEDTGEHLDRMKVYSRTLAQFLYEKNMFLDELNPEYINNLEKFSPMHDIGKVGIRDNILLKQGRLTPEEFEEMKKHTVYGAEVLRAAQKNLGKRANNVFELGIEITEGHHEKWDGSGYPKGKKGREIPLSARIVAIADVFDALTSKRPYKEEFSFEDSYSMIVEGSGKHFDPDIVSVFVENKEKIYHLYNSFKTKGHA